MQNYKVDINSGNADKSYKNADLKSKRPSAHYKNYKIIPDEPPKENFALDLKIIVMRLAK